jgi:ribosomal protein S2
MKNVLALVALLIAAPVRAEEERVLSSDPRHYTLQTPVEIIAADADAAAVLNRDLPGLLTNPSYATFKTMSLKQMQEASGGDLSLVDINKALADLRMLPPR